MLVDDVLMSGGERASILERKIGPTQVLSDLHRYGLRALALTPDASDAEWSSVLSLGEDQLAVTPREVSAFLREIGQGRGGLFSPETARALRAALDGVVQHGNAAGIKNAFVNTRWHIGGKTGTGPASVATIATDGLRVY